MTSPTSAKRRTNFGVKSWNMPSMSWFTSTWPSQPAPAPMPMVGMVSSADTRAASSAGMASRTTAKAPASSTAWASSKSLRAESAVLPCTLKPPSALMPWGVSPMWAHTGIWQSTMARMRSATSTPPSSFTALARASFMRRPAFTTAS